MKHNRLYIRKQIASQNGRRKTMKRKRKPGKICAALAVGIFLAICGMSGCGRGGSNPENSDNTAEVGGGDGEY